MKCLLPILILFLIACGGQNRIIETNTAQKVETPSSTSTKPTETVKTDTQNVKPLINFFSLANKSAAEIEKIYGKPSLIDTKFVQSKNGQYRIYDKSGKRFLQVDYFNGKAVAFYLEIPEAARTQSLENTLKLCSLDLETTDAQKEMSGFWWNNPPAPFYRAGVNKFDDSGLFWNCEVHIKV